MKINPQYVEILAAEAFWNFVFKHGWQATGFPSTIQDIPHNLWSHEILLELIKNKNNTKEINFSNELIDELFYEVAQMIADYGKREENIMGMIYQEDFKYCKEPNFPFQKLVHQQTLDSDKEANYEIQLKGQYINTGDLLLRTPFPSGVLLKSEPIDNIAIIPNTIKAFGFQKKFLLPINRISLLPSNKYGYKYFATGIFCIPTTAEYSNTWLKLIPNASAILNGSELQFPNANYCTCKIIPKSVKNKKNFLKNLISLF